MDRKTVYLIMHVKNVKLTFHDLDKHYTYRNLVPNKCRILVLKKLEVWQFCLSVVPSCLSLSLSLSHSV